MSLFPADPLPLLHRPSTPPSPLGSQVAGLGTDGPPSRLHAGPAGPSKHKTAVVGGHQPDEVQRETGHAVFEGLARTHLPHNEHGEQSLVSWRSNCSQEEKKDTNVRPC